MPRWEGQVEAPPPAAVPAPGAPVRLCVVRGRRFVADALLEALRGDPTIKVVRVADEAAVSLDRLRSVRVDVVLVDASGPGERALEVVRRLRDAHPGLGILAFGSPGDVEAALAFAEAGARACLSCDAGPGELIAAVHDLVRRRTRCPPALAARLVERIARLSGADGGEAVAAHPAVQLTRREREVLSRLVDGLTNKEIAQRMGVAVATVKNHVHSLLTKLGAHRRQEAVRTAYLRGLVDDFLPRRRRAVREGAPGGGPA